MSKGRTIETRTEEVLVPIAEANGVEIYDVEYVKEGSDRIATKVLTRSLLRQVNPPPKPLIVYSNN